MNQIKYYFSRLDKQTKHQIRKTENNTTVKNLMADTDLVLTNSVFNFEGLDHLPLDARLTKNENPLKLIKNNCLSGHAVHTLNEFIQ